MNAEERDKALRRRNALKRKVNDAGTPQPERESAQRHLDAIESGLRASGCTNADLNASWSGAVAASQPTPRKGPTLKPGSAATKVAPAAGYAANMVMAVLGINPKNPGLGSAIGAAVEGVVTGRHVDPVEEGRRFLAAQHAAIDVRIARTDDGLVTLTVSGSEDVLRELATNEALLGHAIRMRLPPEF